MFQCKIMTLQQADQIRQDWGKFLEITNGRLMGLFLGQIPERLLPYKKEVIKEALEMIIKHFSDNGNKEAENAVKKTIPFLDIYINDEKAIKEASNHFSDKDYLDIMSKTSGDDQQKQYEYVLENF